MKLQLKTTEDDTISILDMRPREFAVTAARFDDTPVGEVVFRTSGGEIFSLTDGDKFVANLSAIRVRLLPAGTVLTVRES